MFARLIEAPAKPGKRNEIVTILVNELQPLFKKQPGFVDFIALASDSNPELGMTLSIWNTREDAEKFWASRDFQPILERLKPLTEGMIIRTFSVAASTSPKIGVGKAA